MAFILDISHLSLSKHFYKPLGVSPKPFLQIVIGNLNSIHVLLAFIEYEIGRYHLFSAVAAQVLTVFIVFIERTQNPLCPSVLLVTGPHPSVGL